MPTMSSIEASDERQEGAAAVCPRCGGLGFLRHDLPVDHPDFGKLFPCGCRLEEMETRRAQELRKLSNLNALTRFTFDQFIPGGHGLNPEKRRNLQRAFVLAREFATALSRMPHLVIIPVDNTLARQAVDVAAQYRLRSSDAVYVAVALRFGSTLVTLDRQQRERAQQVLMARLPAEELVETARAL